MRHRCDPAKIRCRDSNLCDWERVNALLAGVDLGRVRVFVTRPAGLLWSTHSTMHHNHPQASSENVAWRPAVSLTFVAMPPLSFCGECLSLYTQPFGMDVIYRGAGWKGGRQGRDLMRFVFGRLFPLRERAVALVRRQRSPSGSGPSQRVRAIKGVRPQSSQKNRSFLRTRVLISTTLSHLLVTKPSRRWERRRFTYRVIVPSHPHTRSHLKTASNG